MTTIQSWKHKLFSCPTFWSLKPKFTCPKCGTTYRCYWDGNDTPEGIDMCNPCAKKIEDRLAKETP